jgi:hypothetical protein
LVGAEANPTFLLSFLLYETTQKQGFRCQVSGVSIKHLEPLILESCHDTLVKFLIFDQTGCPLAGGSALMKLQKVKSEPQNFKNPPDPL